VALRVAVDAPSYAELVAHAKESLDAEVCGVLAGDICEDETGLFVHVQAVVRGTSARQSSTHVTFTQETWNSIHSKLEKDYPRLRVVGWYHSHPGFGVEFSEMDRFIQKNFFAGPTQVALVTDPLGGDVAICLNTPEGIQHLERFWVDGREVRCRVPEQEKNRQPSKETTDAGRLEEGLQAVESRLNQLIQVLDEERTRFHRVLMSLFFLVALCVVGGIGYVIYQSYSSRVEPPQLRNFAPIPVRIGERDVLLGVGLVEWNVPPELNAVYLQLEEKKLKTAEQLLREALRSTNVWSTNVTGLTTNLPGNLRPPSAALPAPTQSPPGMSTNRP
jgi:proteasome lid subunit RPN8/RPN11